MDAWKKEQLAAAGINVAGVLKRFAGNEAPLERMLQRITRSSWRRQEAHMLKGLTGSLSMTALCPLFTRQVEWGPGRGLCHAAGDHTGL